jgi:hypothetical protein
MKLTLALILLAGTATGAAAQYNSTYGQSYGLGTGSNSSSHYVAPHTNHNGSFTQGHHQTNPNSTTLDNYSTNPNVNPYTGAVGTRRGYGQ